MSNASQDTPNPSPERTPLDGEALLARLPKPRGRLQAMAPLAPYTWLRVGGPAEALFTPEDSDDLAEFLAGAPEDVPITPVGVGSNLIVRDGGVRGVAIRLGRGFNAVSAEGAELTCGSAVLDAMAAKAAAKAGIAGLEFLRGVPGAIGGALRMNAGAYGTYTADVLVRAEAIDRSGRKLQLSPQDIGFVYRGSELRDVVYTGAVLRGAPGDPAAIEAHMEALLEKRAASQPIKDRTAGSTFRNPAGFSSTGEAGDPMEMKAWSLIEKAGCRGLRRGGAIMSEKHANFLTNAGGATAADLEGLGEEVRRRVLEATGVRLEWEIQRIGEPLHGAAAE